VARGSIGGLAAGWLCDRKGDNIADKCDRRVEGWGKTEAEGEIDLGVVGTELEEVPAKKSSNVILSVEWENVAVIYRRLEKMLKKFVQGMK